MSWLSEQARQGRNPRTYALLVLLAAALLYVRFLDQGERMAGLRGAAAGGQTAAAPLAAPAAKRGDSTPTPAGWGGDPFRTPFGPGGQDGRR